MNLGGPDSPEAVEPFLFNLFNDPDIIDFPLSFLFRKRLARLISSRRSGRVMKQYAEIGGKSPILDLTGRQAELLSDRFKAADIDARVHIAMRYWKPFTKEAVEELELDRVDRIVLLPLYPHYSKSTTASSFREWDRIVADRPAIASAETIRIESYYDFELYIDAIIERISQGLMRFPEEKRPEVHVLFSAHGTPMKLVREGDPYSHHIRKTVAAVVKRSGLTQQHHLCFQSKVGPMKWLTPSTPDTIAELAESGVKNMLVVPIAFVSDHLETLYEVGIEFRRQAMARGVERFEVTEGLNDSEKFADALFQLVLRALEGKKELENVKSGRASA